MNRILLLIGSLALLAAGTTSAQTSVSLSIGLGEPRPYLEGSVFVGRSYLRPVYRPYYYYYRYHRHRHFAPRYYTYRPFILAPRGYHRPGFGLVEPRRFRREDDDRRFRRDFDRGRGRFDRDRFERDEDH